MSARVFLLDPCKMVSWQVRHKTHGSLAAAGALFHLDSRYHWQIDIWAKHKNLPNVQVIPTYNYSACSCTFENHLPWSLPQCRSHFPRSIASHQSQPVLLGHHAILPLDYLRRRHLRCCLLGTPKAAGAVPDGGAGVGIFDRVAVVGALLPWIPG